MRRMTIHLRTYMRGRSKFDMRLCYQLEMLLAEYEGSAAPLGSGQGQGPKRAAQPRIAAIEHADLAAGVVSLQLVENRPEVGPARREASSVTATRFTACTCNPQQPLVKLAIRAGRHCPARLIITILLMLNHMKHRHPRAAATVWFTACDYQRNIKLGTEQLSVQPLHSNHSARKASRLTHAH